MTIASFFTTSSVFIALAYLLVYYFKKLRLYKEAARFPGPPAYPFIGNALSLIGINEDFINKCQETFDVYPSPFRVWLGGKLIYVVYEPEQIKTIILSYKTLEKNELYKFAVPWIGAGLFTAPAATWRIHRKAINPTFNQKILESFVEIFSAQSEIMVKKMEIEINGGEFDIFRYVSLCTLDFISETAMGISLNAQSQRVLPFVENSKRILQIICTRFTKFWLYPDMIFFRTKLGKEQLDCIKFVHGFIDNVIQKKKQLLEKNREEFSDKNDGKRKTFLDLLLDLSHEGTIFTDKELREHVDSMMVAGYETSATINSFVMLMLANHPQIQEKVYEELCEIYGSENPASQPVKYEDLPRMKYLELVIKETMRLFPIAPFIARYISDDINIGEYTLKKGNSVIMVTPKTHRSEKYWTEPLKFIPERFLPEECAKRHPFSYFPFSAGPRNCIGLKYAMMSMKVLIATTVRKYILKKDKLQSVEDIKLKAEVILKPMETIKIRIERRANE